MTALSASLASGNCPRLDVKAPGPHSLDHQLPRAGRCGVPDQPRSRSPSLQRPSWRRRSELDNPRGGSADPRCGTTGRSGSPERPSPQWCDRFADRRSKPGGREVAGRGARVILASGSAASRTARRSSTSRRQSAQSTRWLSRRSRSASSRAPSTNADRNSARSAQGAFLTPTSPAPDFPVWT